MTVDTSAVPAYRTFSVRVALLRRLGPSFLRVTFRGPDLHQFASSGHDQRMKVLLPLPGRGLVDCPTGPDWYGEWRALPVGRRPPLRTYTVRAVHTDPPEVDVDFVLHGATGPASAWAEGARIGDELVLVGPNAVFDGPTGGVEWRPPHDAAALLVAGDETAVPAICAIAEAMPPGRRAHVLLEVPDEGDVQELAAPDDVRISWLPRRSRTGTAPRGLLLTRAVVAALTDLSGDLTARPPGRTGTAPDDPGAGEADSGVLWDVPAAPEGRSGTYAWLAGEAGMVTGLRRLLIREIGIPRGSVAFMGYWREGVAGA
jgi:NADPH-dependent ferric siderophore reductase